MKSELLVLHISTGHQGGSGLAARRLNYSLAEAGLKTKFVALENSTYQTRLQEIGISRNFYQRIISGVLTKMQKNLSSKIFFSIYTINILNARKIRKIAPSTRTILHFHNWYNIVTQKQIFKFIRMGYPVVITLHDERFYTGGCHHAFDCNGFKFDCRKCPELNNVLKYIPKKNLAKSVSELNRFGGLIHFIAPSKWILDRAQSSALINNEKLYFIPNVPPSLKNISFAEKMNTPLVNSEIIIGVGSMDEKAFIKGGDILPLLKSLIDQKKLPYKIIFLNDKIIQIDPIKRFWEEIDYLLVPSRADNSPNVIHEAKQLGIAVIGTLVGGITELLDPDFDVLIEPRKLSAKTILAKIEQRESNKKMLSKKGMDIKYRQYLGDPVKQHIYLYQEIESNSILQK